ncbi:hypothetical protein GPLA_1848 [Paraglaciecola polaris LMG 21857]|uniref:Uncharacterized protein n=1 Tax=Paraglaciecola polaris LMG 21857 TaxID=1129793 RepID=K7ABK8_9ALTE|nr:hypothetical protein GPLA_1848 [Paraglaciecola polaris LMG 21857]
MFILIFVVSHTDYLFFYYNLATWFRVMVINANDTPGFETNAGAMK